MKVLLMWQFGCLCIDEPIVLLVNCVSVEPQRTQLSKQSLILTWVSKLSMLTSFSHMTKCCALDLH